MTNLPCFHPPKSFRFIAALRSLHQNSLMEAALWESMISVSNPSLLAELAVCCGHCDFHRLLGSWFNAISPSYFFLPLRFSTGIKAAVITMETSWSIKKPRAASSRASTLPPTGTHRDPARRHQITPHGSSPHSHTYKYMYFWCQLFSPL